jgi:hypothetical protein
MARDYVEETSRAGAADAEDRFQLESSWEPRQGLGLLRSATGKSGIPWLNEWGTNEV